VRAGIGLAVMRPIPDRAVRIGAPHTANQEEPAMASHIMLTSHPQGGRSGLAPPVQWGAATAAERGPVIASLTAPALRNAIGTHSGAYAVYRALAVAAGALQRDHKPDLTDTAPAAAIGPHPQWAEPGRIVSLDPWGHLVASAYAERIAAGADIRPTIAVTRAHINMPELQAAIAAGRLQPDGDILQANGDVKVTKAAVDPVWWLPGIAERFGIKESALRRGLFEHTGGMFPELVTRPDLKVFLPPIGGMTLYFFGDVARLGRPATKVACRLHDECNGSDVFGSDICTCRPYLAHGIEVCIEMAQQGGVGLVVYNRKEGRALGEVTKFLVYNARKRQPGGDRAATYFERTECVAGVQDMRFQELMPDVFHWLGIRRIDRWASMSNMKHGALVAQGIEVVERVPIPDALIPADAQVEMDAKKAAGYFSTWVPDAAELAVPKGREL
jgi:GTP cyclohydrolase II